MKQILNEKGSGNKMGILDRLKRGKRTSKEECSGVVSNAKKNSMTAVLFGKLNAAVSIRLKRVFQST